MAVARDPLVTRSDVGQNLPKANAFFGGCLAVLNRGRMAPSSLALLLASAWWSGSSVARAVTYWPGGVTAP
jgi:hypothetical protein